MDATTTARTSIYLIKDSIAPLVPVKWGPNAPYNQIIQPKKLPAIVVAVAQVFSYYNVPSYVEWTDSNGINHSSEINWSEILENEKSVNPMANIKTNNQIAHIMGYLENQFEPDYTIYPDLYEIDSTFIELENVTNWISNLKYFNASKFIDIDINKIRNGIINVRCSIIVGYGNISHDIYGFWDYGGGHAFIIDGYMSHIYFDIPDIEELFHCNWGWNGNMNGFYIAELFSDEEMMIEDDGINHSNKDFTYHLKLQYSIISMQ